METWNFPHFEKDIIIFQIFMVGFDVILWGGGTVVVKKSMLHAPFTDHNGSHYESSTGGGLMSESHHLQGGPLWSL